MIVRDICEAMESWAPQGLACEGDKVGLHIGNPDTKVKTVLTTLTVSEAVLRAARKAKAQMIVAHHPIIFSPLKTLRTDNIGQRLYIDLAAAGIACYAAHTNLDVAPGGVNDILAERLGLLNCRPLIPWPEQGRQMKLVVFVPDSHLVAVRNAVCSAGAGAMGQYSECTFSSYGIGTFRPGEGSNPFIGTQGLLSEEAERRFEVLVPKTSLPSVLKAMLDTHPYEVPAYDIVPLENTDPSVGLGVAGDLPEPITLSALAEKVCRAYKLDHVRVVNGSKRRVKHIGVLGGSGGGEAPKLNVDALVTGDVKYHDALDASRRGVALIDAGHVGTEKWVVPAMTRYLRRMCKGLTVKTFVEPDPFSVFVHAKK